MARRRLLDGGRRARRYVRRLERGDPRPPIPPPLPAGRIVDVPGRGEVFVRQSDGPPGAPTVLLLHGWTASADLNWWRAYDAVGGLASVVAVDHRGHGRGMRSEEPFTLEAAADDAAGVVRALGLRSVIACGYSMGGPISMLLWRRHPELVDALVFQATALEWRASRRERLVWKTMGLLEYVLRLGAPRGMIDRLLRDAIETSPDLAPYQGWLKGELRRGDPTDTAHAGRALGGYDARPFASEVDVPTAVVITTEDRLVRPRKQRALAKAVPGATVHQLRGDHDACLVSGRDFARVTATAIDDVISRLPPRPTVDRR
ncbi:MAG TPA: alpha/beta fold hydrolase [Acidimicrobiales bacterium]|nr:alpha/beta fold hydrolase [Acidimicrobiales bacterium]